MSDDIDRKLEEFDRTKLSCSCSSDCDCCSEDILNITACLKELKSVAKCVFNCLDCHPSAFNIQRVAICVALNEIQAIEAKLDNDVFGLAEIKSEIRIIENEVIAINNTINNGNFGILEIKNEIIEINDIVTNIRNEVNVINTVVGDIINEVVNAINDTVNNQTKGIFEIKNEIIVINEIVTAVNNTVNNGASGIFEIKNEIRSIENEVSIIGNNIVALNRSLSCEDDSVQVCGLGIDGVTRTIRTDVNNVLATLPSASAQSQIGRTYATVFSFIPNIESPVRAIIIENPTDSGRIMYLNSVFGGSDLDPGNQPLSYESAISTSLFGDVQFTSAIPPIKGSNLNLGYPDDSAMNVLLSLSSVGGRRLAATIDSLGHFSLDFAGAIVIPPGHNIAVQLTASGLTTGSKNDVNLHVTATWYELDEPAS